MHKSYLLSFLWLYVINAVAVIGVLVCNHIGVESGTFYNWFEFAYFYFGVYMVLSLFSRAFKVSSPENNRRVLDGRTTRCLTGLLFLSELAMVYANLENPRFYEVATWIFAIWVVTLTGTLATKRLIVPNTETR